MAGDHGLSDEAVLGQARLDRHGWMVKVRSLAEIERWVGIEDLQSAHQEQCEADRVDPMRDTHQRSMAEVPTLGDRPIGAGNGGHIMLRRFGRAACPAHILRVSVDRKVCAL
jgi:hypothetical protein